MPANEDVLAALGALERALPERAVGVVLGSGLGAVAEALQERVSIPYREIPGFPACTVPGHRGVLHVGRLGGREVIVFEGRSHVYEGGGLGPVTFPVRLLAALRARAVLLTTAAGAVSEVLAAGDLVFVRDHINLTGRDPWAEIAMGDRDPLFPDGRHRYHPVLLDRLSTLAFHFGVKYHHGVLCGVTGPSYETPAEVRALRVLGGDVVCMSTVLEVMEGKSRGVPMAAIAVVTNVAGGDDGLRHEDVLSAATSATAALRRFLVVAIEELDWTL